MKLFTDLAAGSRDVIRCKETLHISQIIQLLNSEMYPAHATNVRTASEHHDWLMAMEHEEFIAHTNEQYELMKAGMARFHARLDEQMSELDELFGLCGEPVVALCGFCKSEHDVEALDKDGLCSWCKDTLEESCDYTAPEQICMICHQEVAPEKDMCSTCAWDLNMEDSDDQILEPEERIIYPDMMYEGENYMEPNWDEPLSTEMGADYEKDYDWRSQPQGVAARMAQLADFTDEDDELPF